MKRLSFGYDAEPGKRFVGAVVAEGGRSVELTVEVDSMDPTEAVEVLRAALPADPDDHGSIGVPVDAVRALVGQRVYFCACGARRHAVDIRAQGETLRWPDSYVPGDHIDPCRCEVE